MAGMSRLVWLVRRSAVMGPRELLYRASQAFTARLDGVRGRLGLAAGGARVALDWSHFAFLIAEGSQLFRPPTRGPVPQTERLLADEIPIYGRWTQWRSGAAFWHSDPVTGVEWPIRPGRGIDYRPGNPIGDVRVVWELNRLQHLFALARIAVEQQAERSRAVSVIARQLASWNVANPPRTGVNSISALEQALRLIALLHTYDLVRQWVSAEFRQTILDLVVEHAEDIESRPSLFSSAGNHTIGEAVGLLYAGTLLPENARAAHWRHLARKLLETESRRQVLTDGGSLEQSTWYLLFLVDLLGLAQMLLAHSHAESIPEVNSAVLRGRSFLSSLGTSPTDIPRIGDADDGFALCPDLTITWSQGAPEGHHDYPDAGITVASDASGSRLLFLHNDLGMPPNFAHGHGDCLSVLFDYQGQPVLIDPGTYRYGGAAGFRHYFRSTVAHNTVSVDKLDQGKQIGSFMWGSPFRCKQLLQKLSGETVVVLAKHDGYRRLGCTHFRGVCYRPNHFLAVWDLVRGPPQREVSAHWHLGVTATQADIRAPIELHVANGSPIVMESTAETSRIFAGSRDPILGWKSEGYGELRECQTISSRLGLDPQLTVFWLPGSTRDRVDINRWTEEFGRLAALDRSI